MNAHENVFQYLSENLPQETTLIETIKNMHFHIILAENIKAIDPKHHTFSKMSLAKQTAFNALVQREICFLSQLFESHGIQLIHLKGLCLAEELYTPSASRLFRDIDVLIDPIHLETALNILGEHGYLTGDTHQPVSAELINDHWMEHSKIHSHIPTLVKQHTLSPHDNASKINIPLDLHVRLFNNPESEWHFMQKIMGRSIKKKMFSHDVWLLELNDQLIQLMIHFSKEYTVDLFLSGNAKIRMWLLYDIALLIDQYSERLDWDIILDRVSQWHLEVRALFTAKLCNKIFPQKIPSTWIKQLQQRIMKEYCTAHPKADKKTIQDMEDMLDFDPNVFLREDPHELLHNFMTSIAKGPRLHCPHKNNPEHLAILGQFTIDETQPNIPNYFKTHRCFGEKPESSEEYSAKGQIFWDDTYLYLNINVLDQQIETIIAQKEELDVVSLSIGFGDALMLEPPLGKEKAPQARKARTFIQILHFVYKIKETQLMEVYSSLLDAFLEDHRYVDPYEVHVHKDGFDMSLQIPWTLLGIQPTPAKKLVFDIDVHFHHLEGGKKRGRQAFANKYSPLWQPEFLGVLQLEP